MLLTLSDVASGTNSTAPRWLQIVLGLFFLLFAGLGVPYARKAWLIPSARSGLEPAAFWPYSPERWSNMVRALPWGIAAFDVLILAVAVVNLDSAAVPVLLLVIAPLAGLLMVVFLLLTATGRPKRLLSPHF